MEKGCEKNCAQVMDIAPRIRQRMSVPERLLSPENALIFFCSTIGVFYCLVPLIVYLTFPVGDEFLCLAEISLCAVLAMLLGGKIQILDHRFKSRAARLNISHRVFITLTWMVFLVFIVFTLATAPTIPFISALQGASADELSQQRGDFLKGREGAGILLLYLSTFLTNTIVPYSVILLYAKRSVFRNAAAFLFFLFCVSFMQKALFLNLVLPLLVFLAIKRRLGNKTFVLFAVGSAMLLLVSVFLSLGENQAADLNFDFDKYFSAQYIPGNALDYFAWRAAAVPIFTATDTLVVHADQFRGNYLLGATSGLISLISGVERINIERFVFEHQFGSWNEIANANAVFVVDAYVNFGLVGVIMFGVFVGIAFRLFGKSDDVAFKALWGLFAVVLFTGSLLGALLSNGFAYMLFHGLFFRLSDRKLR